MTDETNQQHDPVAAAIEAVADEVRNAFTPIANAALERVNADDVPDEEKGIALSGVHLAAAQIAANIVASCAVQTGTSPIEAMTAFVGLFGYKLEEVWPRIAAAVGLLQMQGETQQ